MISFTILVIICIALFSAYWLLQYRSNFPPGPLGLPIFGHLLQLTFSKKLHLDLCDLSKKYGPLFSLKFGSHDVVVLHSSSVIHEAFVKNSDCFSERPSWLYLMKKLQPGSNKGILFNQSKWSYARKLGLKALRGFGLGKKSVEEKVKLEAESLVEALENKNGQAIDITLLASSSISNIICQIVFDKRFEYDDEQYGEVVEAIGQLLGRNNMLMMPNFIPWTTPFYLLLNLPRMKMMKQCMSVIKKFVNNEIDKHEKNYADGDIKDFIDLIIQQTKEDKDVEDMFSDGGTFKIIMDLFVAGTETTSTYLRWFFAYMLHFPEIQSICRDEVHKIIGKSKVPTYNDAKECITVQALIHEILRINPIIPFAIPHATKKKVQLLDYEIPKNTYIIPSIYASHFDETYWREPKKFNPQRWIDENGKLLNYDAFMIFGIGKRSCLGIELARMEMFIFTAMLLQRFNFKVCETLPDITGHIGMTYTPKPYKLVFESI